MDIFIYTSIEYHGHYQKIVGKTKETICVSPILELAIHDLRIFLNDTYSLNQGFMVLINNDNIIKLLKIDAKMYMTDKDVFKIIPITSGG